MATQNEVYGSGTTPQRGDTQRMLLVKQLQTLSPGGGGFQGYSGDYGGVKPTVTPGTAFAVAVDTVTGQIFWFYGGQWN